MRPKITIDPFRNTITNALDTGDTIEQVLRDIQQDVPALSLRTLKRRLVEWGYQQYQRSDDSILLRVRIGYLFYDCVATDKEILIVLHEEGFEMSPRWLQQIRLEMGCRTCVPQLRCPSFGAAGSGAQGFNFRGPT